MTGSGVGRYGLVFVFGPVLGLALAAGARAQQATAGTPPGSKPGQSVPEINAEYERQVLELDRRRLDALSKLAARQDPAEAAATYEQLFRLAVGGNLFREAEPAASAVVANGSRSTTTVALAYLVKIVAQADRGAFDDSLATLRAALQAASRPGAGKPALLTSEVVSLCDAYYQRLAQVDQFDTAKKAFRLALEQVKEPTLKAFLESRLRRLDLAGKPAPALRGTDLDGKTFDLAGEKGHVVLVVFWATWCEPCGEQVEWLKETARAYRARGFRVVGVNLDALHESGEPAAKVLPKVRQFLLDHNVTWPTLLNGTGDADFAHAFGVTDIPASVIVARDGTVAHIDLVHEHLDDAIAKELDR